MEVVPSTALSYSGTPLAFVDDEHFAYIMVRTANHLNHHRPLLHLHHYHLNHHRPPPRGPCSLTTSPLTTTTTKTTIIHRAMVSGS